MSEKARRHSTRLLLLPPSYPALSLLPTFPAASGPSVAGQDSQTCKDGSKPSEKPKPQRILEGVLQTIKPSSVMSEIQICQILPRFASCCQTPAEAKNHSNLKQTCLPNTPCQGTHTPELFHRRNRLMRVVLVWATSYCPMSHAKHITRVTTPCFLTAQLCFAQPSLLIIL